jgi:hypothetical protein
MIERGRNFLPLLVLVCHARLGDRSAHMDVGYAVHRTLVL